MDRYTRYYANETGGGGGEMGPVYRANFRVQRGRGIGSFFGGPFSFIKPLLYSGEKDVGKVALKTVSNMTDILKDLEKRVAIFSKNILGEAKGNLEQKIKEMTGSGLSLKKHAVEKTSFSK
jgi:hypothetical protein